MKHSSPLLALSLAAVLCGCNRETTTPGAAAAPTVSTQPPAAAQPSSQPSAKTTIGRIVFVDQAKCCACTRERIDNSWKALTDVVGYPPIPDVERIHMDTHKEKAAPYTKQKPVMVPPAIYFLSQQGQLVQTLQGEIDVAQIRKVMGRAKP